MLAIVVEQPGPDSLLRYVQVADPQIRPADVMIRTRAAGVNRADLSFRKGAYGNADWGDSPLMGLEVAGDIVAVGSEAVGWRAGDRVMSVVGGGGYAELARVDHRMLLPIPQGMDYVRAAAIPEAFITAHECLCHLGSLTAGEAVLIHAAGSGVGVAAVQLACAVGAEVFTTSSAEKHERLRALGVRHCIDRKSEDFAAAVAAVRAGRGIDVILDFVGASYFERNVRLLASGGRLVQAGLMEGNADQTMPMSPLVSRHLRIMGTVMKSRPLAEKCAMVARFSQRWLDRFDNGQLSPVIDAVYPIRDAARAHEYLASNAGFGKVVLSLL
jgi:NADPH:quinone reductase